MSKELSRKELEEIRVLIEERIPVLVDDVITGEEKLEGGIKSLTNLISLARKVWTLECRIMESRTRGRRRRKSRRGKNET